MVRLVRRRSSEGHKEAVLLQRLPRGIPSRRRGFDSFEGRRMILRAPRINSDAWATAIIVGTLIAAFAIALEWGLGQW